MDLKDILRRAKFLISVPRCIGCGERLDFSDDTLCPECLKEFQKNLTRNCSVCSKPLAECLCSNHYLRRHGIKSLAKVARYVRKQDDNPLNRLVFSLKQDHLINTVEFIATQMSPSVQRLISNVEAEKIIVTNVARSRRSISKYGYDQSALLAKAIAKKLGLEYASLFVSMAKKKQKMTSGEERKRNAIFKLRRKIPSLNGRVVIIIDDIATTGASIGACADVLLAEKPDEIFAAVFAIAYLDNYILPPNKQTSGII